MKNTPNSKVTEILEKIRLYEEELEEAVKTHEVDFFYRVKDNKIKFKHDIKAVHRKLKVGLFDWFKKSQPRNIISAPVIYSLIIPFLMLDLFVTVYQILCFPLYRIKMVKRSKYVVIDRHHLSYLNSIEKLNCVYCGYVSGVVRYTTEILSRTEQYWCPIKHASKILNPHYRYARFADFGDHENYPEHLKNSRANITESTN